MTNFCSDLWRKKLTIWVANSQPDWKKLTLEIVIVVCVGHAGVERKVIIANYLVCLNIGSLSEYDFWYKKDRSKISCVHSQILSYLKRLTFKQYCSQSCSIDKTQLEKLALGRRLKQKTCLTKFRITWLDLRLLPNIKFLFCGIIKIYI